MLGLPLWFQNLGTTDIPTIYTLKSWGRVLWSSGEQDTPLTGLKGTIPIPVNPEGENAT